MLNNTHRTPLRYNISDFFSSLLDELSAAGMRVDDFYLPEHRLVFHRMSQMKVKGFPIDLPLLHDELLRTNEIEKIGGCPFLAHLIDGCYRVCNIAYYVEVLQRLKTLRNLISYAYEIFTASLDPGAHP